MKNKGIILKIKWLKQEEDITFVNIYAPSTGAPKYIKQLLADVQGETDSNALQTLMERWSREKVRNKSPKWHNRLAGLHLCLRTQHQTSQLCIECSPG